MGCSKSSSKREVREIRESSSRKHNFTPKTTVKRRTKTPQISRRKEIINIWAEINEREMKET